MRWNPGMKTAFVTFVSLLCAFSSRAMAASHEYNAQMRPFMAGKVYLSQQVQYTQSTATLSLRNTDPALSGTKSMGFDGYSLRTTAGVEHMKFLQTAVFYSNLQENDRKGGATDLRAHEIGAEAKMSFASPVANFVLGGGIFVSRANLRDAANTATLSGQGYLGGVDLVYYPSVHMNLLASVNYVSMSLADKTEKAPIARLQSSGFRAGVGVALWL